jgi:hypothetical protein
VGNLNDYTIFAGLFIAHPNVDGFCCVYVKFAKLELVIKDRSEPTIVNPDSSPVQLFPTSVIALFSSTPAFLNEEISLQFTPTLTNFNVWFLCYALNYELDSPLIPIMLQYLKRVLVLFLQSMTQNKFGKVTFV